jgi:Arc/MetJ-type ribon-helix-helix transcriptional regulator
MRAILNISLPEAMVAEVKEEIKTGKYSTVSEFFRKLIRDWQEEKLLRELKASEAEIRSGKFVTLKSLKDLR